jgi:effector-binding domain-containing protein
MLRKALAGVLIIIILFLTIGFFLPKRIDTSKSISIQAPIDYVFEELNEVERWSNWSYAQITNRTLQITYGERKSGKGASFKWSHGKAFIRESTPNISLTADVQLQSDTVKYSYKLKQMGDTTVLTTNLKRDNVGNLFERWYSLFFPTAYSGKALNNELQRIKLIAEGKPIFSILITLESLAPTYYIHLSKKVNQNNIREMRSEKILMYEELKKVLSNSKTQRIAPPFCIYPNINQESTDIICAFTISPDARFPENFPVLQHYSGAAVRGIHNGGHYSLKKTHEELLSYIRYKNYEKNGVPWEAYLSDITNEKDSSYWVTEVYYPVK